MNTSLTVAANTPASNHNKGWEPFMVRMIELLNKKDTPVVFLLWDNHARVKATLRGFFGCRHFSKANLFLRQAGQPEIDWQIQNI